jgi:hypothetical protein
MRTGRTNSVHILPSDNEAVRKAKARRSKRKKDEKKEKVGSNLLFGMFDTVLCGVPEVLCGPPNAKAKGVGSTPMA